MIDSIDALAFSMHSAKGVYALLLGSGISRSAAIPTGWEIVLDLVGKLAALKGEDCEPEPALWYQNQFGKEPDYSELLEELTKGSAETRQQVLAKYIEPTQAQLEQGLKMPTEAHKAIASLVASGHIQVILTTNFDRLLEKALDAVGINPTVISTPAEVAGMAPISRTKCLIVKLHGDYLDTRIKNIKAELNSYEDSINQLLNQVFDEYGLIISGWSAEWDIALKEALQRCKSRRYTTYWTARGDLTESAERVVQQRGAQVVKTSGADQFFQQLADKVHALEEFETPHPLSSEIAVATLKKHLSDDKLILANDLVMQAASDLHGQLSEENFPLNTSWSQEEFQNRIRRYESLVTIPQSVIIAGCYWGTEKFQSLWSRCIQRVADAPEFRNGIDAWVNLKQYSAFLLLYSGGIAAFSAQKYDTFAALMSTEIYHSGFRKDLPAVISLDGYSIFENVAKYLPEGNTFFPVSMRLCNVLREPLRTALPQDKSYEKTFDQFEYLMALIYADQGDKHLPMSRGDFWAPSGYFSFRDYHRSLHEDRRHPIIGQQIPAQTLKALLDNDLFNGSPARFETVKQATDDVLLKNWANRVMMGR